MQPVNLAMLAAVVLLSAVGCTFLNFGEQAKKVPAARTDGLVPVQNAPKAKGKVEYATIAAGCFWGVEKEFRKLPGVLATAVGYTGGHTKNPTYKEVCEMETGHAEAVKIEFDSSVISYEAILEEFFALHDPTTVDRQGPDVGSQYRSAIFYHSPQQKKIAEEAKAKLNGSGELTAPVVTEIAAAGTFYRAEEYHQQWTEKGNPAYCQRRKPSKRIGG